VNVAAAASVAIQRDLMNLNMWGVLFASIYPCKTPTFESSNLISSTVPSGLNYSKIVIFGVQAGRRWLVTSGSASEAKRRRNSGSPPRFTSDPIPAHGMLAEVTALFAAL
jgi:hypothetical protein